MGIHADCAIIVFGIKGSNYGIIWSAYGNGHVTMDVQTLLGTYH